MMTLRVLTLYLGVASGLMPLTTLPRGPLQSALPASRGRAFAQDCAEDGCDRNRHQAPRRLGQPKMQLGDPSSGFSFWGPAKVGKPHHVLQGQRQAWVLIFRPGREDEGVYTLQGAPREPSSPTSFVLAFEHTDDAMQFAQRLHQQGFDVATPLPWSSDDLVYFCEGAGYEVSLVPTGAQITPPPMHDLSHNRDSAAADHFGRPRFDTNPGFGEPNFFNRPVMGGGDPRLGRGGPGFGPGSGGDPRFNAHFDQPGYNDFGGMPHPGDPGRMYPGLDPSRPDAYATERNRLEALLPQQPDDCQVDGADDDCLHP